MGGQALKLDDGSGAYWLHKSSTKEELKAAQKDMPLVWGATINDKSDTLYEFPSFSECHHVENILRYNVCVVGGLSSLSSLFGWKAAVCSSSRNCQILRIPLPGSLTDNLMAAADISGLFALLLSDIAPFTAENEVAMTALKVWGYVLVLWQKELRKRKA